MNGLTAAIGERADHLGGTDGDITPAFVPDTCATSVPGTQAEASPAGAGSRFVDYLRSGFSRHVFGEGLVTPGYQDQLDNLAETLVIDSFQHRSGNMAGFDPVVYGAD